MDPFVLRRRILGVIAAAVPLAAACGGTDGGGSDAGDASSECNSCFCGAPIPPGPKYDVTYTVCPPFDYDAGTTADASDDAASDDAATDASDEDSGVPSVCYYGCDQACSSQMYTGGSGHCIGEDGADAGTRVAHCQVQYLCGRRLDGLVDPRSARTTPLGDALAHAAWLEAASIHAFRRLARELRAHGAPQELVDAARACARDEAKHARTMARLAKRHGATIARVEIEPVAARDLEAIARENAVEGCVGETYGALLATWQAEQARDEGVREAMREIAPDELRHAALAWSVAAWADSRLSPEARARVRSARDAAARDLLHNANMEPDQTVARATGAPRSRDAARLAATMHQRMWS